MIVRLILVMLAKWIEWLIPVDWCNDSAVDFGDAGIMDSAVDSTAAGIINSVGMITVRVIPVC